MNRSPSPSPHRELEVIKPAMTTPLTLPPPPPPLPPSRSPTRLFKPQKLATISSPNPLTSAALHSSATRPCHGSLMDLDRFNIPFQACHMFFYGSLMDPEVVQAVLGLPDLPVTTPATISGFRIKMWGIYPALIPSPSGEVLGSVWEVTLEDHFQRLAAYETAAYTWIECEATLEDNTVLKGCRTFCWAGSPDSKELEAGSFDLERYQKYFKSSVTRQWPAES